jgi:hypothetical protein
MTFQSAQLIGSAIAPINFGNTTVAQPANSSSSTAGSGTSSLSTLGAVSSGAAAAVGAAAGASSGASGVAPASSSSGSDISPGTLVGAAKLGGSLTGNSTLSTAASLAGNALAIYNGVKEGGVLGYGSAAVNAVKGANTVDSLTTGSGFLSAGEAAGVGVAGNVLGIASGIKQGGIAGYGSAAINAAQLYGNVGTLVNAYEGTTAAGAGVAAGDAAVGADAAAGAGSATAGSAAAGLSASASVGLAAVPLAVFMYGESKPGVQLSSTTWGNINNEIKAGIGGYGSGATVQQVLTAAQQLQGLQSGITNPANPSDIAGADPAAMLAGMQQYGITSVSQIQPLVEKLLNSIPAGAMPGQAAGVQSAKGGDLGMATGSGSKNTTQAY